MTAPKIEKLLTPYNFTNANNVGRIKYIVIHYVGALGGAWANCHYYASKYLGASAHYFVGFEGEIWQSVEDEDIAWHCGAKSYKHAECRNSNSIGIELCVRNKGSQADTSKDWYFEDATVASAIELTQYLMKKYNVPADHVIRHYDVTGKICPKQHGGEDQGCRCDRKSGINLCTAFIAILILFLHHVKICQTDHRCQNIKNSDEGQDICSRLLIVT